MTKPLLTLVCLALVCLAAFLSGCDTTKNGLGPDHSVYVAQLETGSGPTWAQTKITLSNLSLKPIQIDNESMKAVADIDGATVTVSVATYDLNQTQLQVSAKKYTMSDGSMAKMVFDKIIADLGQKP